MENSYNSQEREQYWTQKWVEDELYKTPDNVEDPDKNEYVLDMFPYPSGAGLHLGHAKGYTASDIYSRMRRMQGKNVLHTMGYDAFGLPAERFAMEQKIHPAEGVAACIQSFRQSLQRLGFSYDWSREVNTSDPNYYKWTQWIFKKLHEKGLARYDYAEVDWCPQLGTVLAQDEIEDEGPNKGLSKRGGYPVIRKKVKQWILNITKYADRLIEGLDDVEWTDREKQRQINHIGRAEGVNIKFSLETGEDLEVFTTKPETLHGVTFVVLSMDHPMLDSIVTPERKTDVEKYIKQAKAAAAVSNKDRATLEKTGVSTGAFAIHPFTKEKIPLWVADYVASGYATEAVMGVPSGDDRDRDFAAKYELPLIDIYENNHYKGSGDGSDESEGVLRNSGSLDGLNETEARAAIIRELESSKTGYRKVNYRMHDWIFSRQRYWGEPFPVIHQKDGSIILIDDAELPLELPSEPNYPPAFVAGSDGEAVSDEVETILGRSKEWVETERGARETNTMPGAAGSSWYFMRYIDPQNQKEFANSGKLNAWLPVDLYMGGAEHTTGHVLYARFWHMVLHDAGLIDSPEPFKKIVNQGLILGEDGEKMSKSSGNAVSVDDTIKEHGADILRVYTMFLGPYARSARWDSESIVGVQRWIYNVIGVFDRVAPDAEMSDSLKRELNECIKKVTSDTAALKFNTAIAAMMDLVNNKLKSVEKISPELAQILCKLIAPYAPMLAEEMWCNALGQRYSVHQTEWPEYDETLATMEVVKVVVQVNGKVRGTIDVDPSNATNEEIVAELARASEKIAKALADKDVLQQHFVPGRLINFVFGKN